MTIGEIIAKYCKEHNMSYRQFAEKSGLTSGYISMLVNNRNPKTGKPPIPRIDTYTQIADAMGVSVVDILEETEKDTPTTFNIITKAGTAQIKPKSRSDYKELAKSIAGFIEDVLERDNLAGVKRIPILGDTAAGQPIIANREYDEYIDIPIDGRRFDAAVRVKGDSMEPGYHIGDLALVRYQDDVDDGQIVVVCLDEEVTLKRLYHMSGSILLQSDNKKYPPMAFTSEDYANIHLVGKVVGVIHWEE